MTRPVLASIDLSALRRNFAQIRAFASGSRVAAVVKADAYGHGIRRILPALADADGLALLNIEDAVLLREAGYGRRILLLEGAFDREELDVAARLGLHVVIHCDEQIGQLESLAPGAVVHVHLKLNSGMNRLGFVPGAFERALARLRVHPAVASLTLMTHFACADDGRGVEAQIECFDRAAGDSPFEQSLANSAALIRFPAARRDWVRPGIVLYGATPFEDRSAADLGLAPVMTLTSRLIAVQDLRAGDHVGYGQTFTAPRSMRVGVVACGYADGYPRHAPTGTPIVVGDVRTVTTGRVSMDMLMVDLSNCPGAGVGTPVTLWGEGMPVDEVALSAGTIGYELLCALAPRVPVRVVEG
jgi:alanine racemase